MQREHHRPLSEGQVTRIEHDEIADSSALDIFHGIIVRGNINLYIVIIALAFSNGKRWSAKGYIKYAAPTHLQGVIITILMNIGYFLCQRKAPSGLVETKGKILSQRPQRIRQGP